MHRPDRAGVAALAAQFARPHPQEIKRTVEGQREGVGVGRQQFIQRLDRGDELRGVLDLQQFDQTAAQRGGVGGVQRALETGQPHLGGGRVERGQVVFGSFLVGVFLGQRLVSG